MRKGNRIWRCEPCHQRRVFHRTKTEPDGPFHEWHYWMCSQGHTWIYHRFTLAGIDNLLKTTHLESIEKLFNERSRLYSEFIHAR